jgi:hypothetical protein
MSVPPFRDSESLVRATRRTSLPGSACCGRFTLDGDGCVRDPVALGATQRQPSCRDDAASLRAEVGRVRRRDRAVPPPPDLTGGTDGGNESRRMLPSP